MKPLWLNKALWVGGLLLLAFIGLNRLAYLQAEGMTHYSTGGDRTSAPEKLSFFGKIKVIFTGVSFPRPRNNQTPEDVRLPYKTYRYLGKNGKFIEAWAIFHPDPKLVILMFHGYGSSKSGLLQEAKRLYVLGFDPFLVDFQGSGGSEGDRTTLGYEEAGDVAASYEFVPQFAPSRPRVLYGNSMGAVAVMKAVHSFQLRPDGVILECPFDSLLHTVRNRFRAMGLPSFPGAELLVFWGGRQCGFDGFQFNPINYAASLEGQVLYMAGGMDPRVTPAQSQALYDRIMGHKRSVLFENAGHESFAAQDGEKWGQSVMDFIHSLPKRAPVSHP